MEQEIIEVIPIDQVKNCLNKAYTRYIAAEKILGAANNEVQMMKLFVSDMCRLLDIDLKNLSEIINEDTI